MRVLYQICAKNPISFDVVLFYIEIMLALKIRIINIIIFKRKAVVFIALNML